MSVCAAFALFAATLAVGTASSEAHPCCYGDPAWYHQHRLQYKTLLSSLDNDTFRHEANQARKEWRDRTILGLKWTDSHQGARIHGRDNNYGNTGWSGLAEICFHCNHADFFLNSYYSQSDNAWQGTACQEIGHLVGLDHMAGDCMGKGYFPSNYTNHVGSKSINHIKNYYENPPDGSPTHVSAGTSSATPNSDKESDLWDLLGG